MQFFFSVSACLEKGVIQLNVTGGVCCIECFSCHGLSVLSLLTHLLTVLSIKVFCCKFIFGEIFCLSFAVSQTSFTMTNSMSLSTHRSWHSPHTTSPQYVVKVRIFSFHSLYCNWILLQFGQILSMLQAMFLPASKSFLLSLFSTEKSAAVGCCSMQSTDWILVATLGEPRWGMCGITGERNKPHAVISRWFMYQPQTKCCINTKVKLSPFFIFLQKHLILLIKGLCTGCSRLDRTEIITFTAMMKSAKLPQTVKTLSDGECSLRDGPKLNRTSIIMIRHHS